MFAFYLGWSMMQIPYYAWSGELSDDYDQRTRIASYQNVAGAIGLLLVLVLPTIIDQVAPGDGARKLGAMGALVLASLGLGLWLTLNAYPERPAPARPASGPGLWRTLVTVFSNGLLLRVLASDFAVMLGQTIRGTLFVFIVDRYMGLPAWSSGLFLAQFIFGIVAGPLWMAIGLRLGKSRAAVLGELAQAAINLGLLCLVRGEFALLVALTVAQGLTQGSGNLMLRAMVADVADAHRLATGEDRTALFFSVFSISMKAATAVAVGIALPLVAWLGFDPRTAHNGPAALKGLLLVFSLGPALAHLASAALIGGFPLDAAAHAEVRRRLREREGQGADAAAAGAAASAGSATIA
ncbi:MAG: MFS transporter [Steroidobacteraceae bacterium]